MESVEDHDTYPQEVSEAVMDEIRTRIGEPSETNNVQSDHGTLTNDQVADFFDFFENLVEESFEFFKELEMEREPPIPQSTSRKRSHDEMEDQHAEPNPASDDQTIDSLSREISELRDEVVETISGSVDRATRFLAVSQAAKNASWRMGQARQASALLHAQLLGEMPYNPVKRRRTTVGPDDAGMLARLGPGRGASGPPRRSDVYRFLDFGDASSFPEPSMYDFMADSLNWLNPIPQEYVGAWENIEHGALAESFHQYELGNGWFEAERDFQDISMGFNVARRSPVEVLWPGVLPAGYGLDGIFDT
ncbi:hypothetical protein CkaCkLH20_09739 [Colletotrichum karsti]|uniref:Uncharacterized protein n=1 Tax=Colletotrichum karsti TaxID=1095194 RepID=A0A9P6I0Z4_9PEZI|nr:uncharacterized protein CkaCkLH20_09739 [Colletotrichum karsti]KAF9872876.1 hypothetical protein CkaCkLH20_09739 [Colletotrichum karsti]